MTEERRQELLKLATKPMLYNTEMVKAINDGRKTETRRTQGLEELNTYPGLLEGECPLGELGYKGLLDSAYILNAKSKLDFKKNAKYYHWFLGEHGREINPIPVKSPYAVGGVVYVRETWAPVDPYSIEYDANHIYYGTDGCVYKADNPDARIKWRPSIHMPKEFARLFLEITDVRAERIQEISEESAKAEGVERVHLNAGGLHYTEYRNYRRPDMDAPGYRFCTVKMSFMTLWDSIYHNWDENPWVWVYKFKVME